MSCSCVFNCRALWSIIYGAIRTSATLLIISMAVLAPWWLIQDFCLQSIISFWESLKSNIIFCQWNNIFCIHFAGFFTMAWSSCWCQVWPDRCWAYTTFSGESWANKLKVSHVYWWIYSNPWGRSGNMLYTPWKPPWYRHSCKVYIIALNALSSRSTFCF